MGAEAGGFLERCGLCEPGPGWKVTERKAGLSCFDAETCEEGRAASVATEVREPITSPGSFEWIKIMRGALLVRAGIRECAIGVDQLSADYIVPRSSMAGVQRFEALLAADAMCYGI